MVIWEGQTYSKSEFQKKFGELGEQLMREGEIGFYEDHFRGPFARNMSCMEIRSKKDFGVRLAPERALEVLEVRLDQNIPPFQKGRSALFESYSGVCHPFYLNYHGLGVLFGLQGFFTCGPDNVGGFSPEYTLHGYFTWLPVKSIRQQIFWDGDELLFEVKGTIDCQRIVTGPYIIVERVVTVPLGQRNFRITDTLTATHDTDIMWKYHPNFKLAPGAQLVTGAKRVIARDKDADHDLENWNKFPVIDDELPEKVYRLECVSAEGIEDVADGTIINALLYENNNAGIYVSYNSEEFTGPLSFLTIWRNTRDGALGIEPGSTVMGRHYAEKNDLCLKLCKGESRSLSVEIGFLTTREEVRKIRDKITLILGGKKTALPEIIFSGDKNFPFL